MNCKANDGGGDVSAFKDHSQQESSKKVSMNSDAMRPDMVGSNLTSDIRRRSIDVTQLLLSLLYAASKTSSLGGHADNDPRSIINTRIPLCYASCSRRTTTTTEPTAEETKNSLGGHTSESPPAEEEDVPSASTVALPWDTKQVQQVLLCVASKLSIQTLKQLLGGEEKNLIAALGEIHQQAYPLLRWALASNRNHLRLLCGQERLKLRQQPISRFNGCKQYIITGPIEHEKKFQRLKREAGLARRLMNGDDRDRDALKVLYPKCPSRAALAIVRLVLEGHPGPCITSMPRLRHPGPAEEETTRQNENIRPTTTTTQQQGQKENRNEGSEGDCEDGCGANEPRSKKPRITAAPAVPRRRSEDMLVLVTPSIHQEGATTAAAYPTDGGGGGGTSRRTFRLLKNTGSTGRIVHATAVAAPSAAPPATAPAAVAPAAHLDLSDDTVVLLRARLLLQEGNSALREQMITKATEITAAVAKDVPAKAGVCTEDNFAATNSGGSFYAWHGSQVSNWHNILRTGLKNLSHLEGAIAAQGPGIYTANAMHVPMSFSLPRGRESKIDPPEDDYDDVGKEAQKAYLAAGQQNGGQTCPPKGERLVEEGLVCMALCEIVNRPEDFSHAADNFMVVPQEEWVRTRYFFVFPKPSMWPKNRLWPGLHKKAQFYATNMVRMDESPLP